MESEAIESNKYFDHIGKDKDLKQDLTELENTILVEEFVNFEKMRNDFLNFLLKFFDNSKTNMYKNIVSSYEEKTKRDFFDFFFITMTSFMYAYCFPKTRQNIIYFIKILISTSNEQILKKYVAYFKKNIYKFTLEAENAYKSMNDNGNHIFL